MSQADLLRPFLEQVDAQIKATGRGVNVPAFLIAVRPMPTHLQAAPDPGTLEAQGPLIYVIVTLDGCSAIQGSAIVDPGGQISFVQPGLLDGLTLPAPVSYDLLGPDPKPRYPATVEFPCTALPARRVSLMPHDLDAVQPGLRFLLGRDFLRGCVMTYDGVRGAFMLAI